MEPRHAVQGNRQGFVPGNLDFAPLPADGLGAGTQSPSRQIRVRIGRRDRKEYEGTVHDKKLSKHRTSNIERPTPNERKTPTIERHMENYPTKQTSNAQY